MFLGLAWYWWLALAVVLLAVIPLKLKFLSWWSRRRKEEEAEKPGKWGG